MLKGKGAEIVKASLEKKTRLPWWPSGCDAVFHLRVLSLGRDLGSWMPCSEASINKQSRKSILADLKTYYLTIVIRVVWCWWRYSVQFSSVAQLCPTLQPHGLQLPGLPVHHQLPELTQTRVHRVGDAIQPSHPLSSPSPPALNLSQHQGLFQWVSSLHQVAKVLEFHLQHRSFQWIFRKQKKRIENWGTHPHKYTQPIFDRGAKAFQQILK